MFRFANLTGLIVMKPTCLSLIVALVAFVNGARSGKSQKEEEIANLDGNAENQ